MVKEETSDVGSLETAREELHMKGSSVSDLGIDKTTVKGEEQDFQFTEACGSVTEAFSEEDLTAITGSADDEARVVGAKEGDEDRNCLDETCRQTSTFEESAKVFLEEILQEVCRDIENVAQAEHKELLDAGQDGTIPSGELLADTPMSDLENSEDVEEDNLLSDEALEQLDRELEEVHGAKEVEIVPTEPCAEQCNVATVVSTKGKGSD